MAYASYISLGQLLLFDNQYILHVQNIILNIISGYCFLQIIYYFYERQNFIESNIIIAIYLFNPLINSSLINLNLDFPVLVFFIILIYSYLIKNNILFLISSIFLIFSKENGIALYSIFFGIFFILHIHFYKYSNNIHLEKFNKIFLLPPLLLVIYFLSKFILDQQSLFSAGYGSPLNLLYAIFSWNYSIIITRILQIFLLNFNWIPTIFIFFALIKLTYLRTNSLSIHKSYNLLGIGLVAIFYLTLTIFLFQYLVHPRYIVANIFFILLFFILSVIYLVKNRIIRYVILGCYLTLIVLQNVRSIDPLSNKFFGYYYLGSHKIISIDGLIADPYGFGPRDALAYNLEFTILDKLIRKFYTSIKSTNPSYIITEDMDHPTIHPKIRNEGNQIAIIVLSELEKSIKNINANQTGYYVHIPQKHNSQVGLNIIQKYFEVVNSSDVTLDGYSIYYYELRKSR